MIIIHTFRFDFIQSIFICEVELIKLEKWTQIPDLESGNCQQYL